MSALPVTAGVACAVGAAGVLTTVVFVFVVTPLASFARVLATKGSVGFGPRLFSLRISGTPIDIKLVPFTSWVKCVGMDPFAEEEPPAPPRLSWLDAPPWRRALGFLVAPRVAPLIVPVFVLGPSRTLAAVVSGLPQLFYAFGSGRPLLERGAEVLAREGWITLFALAICKFATFQLLIIPNDLVQTVATRSIESLGKILAKVRSVVMLASVALWIAWLVTWARWAF